MSTWRYPSAFAIAQRRTSCGDHGQAAREADAHQANLAIGRQHWLPRQPQRRVLDLVHCIEGEAVARQIGERDREHRHSARRQIAGEALQPGLVDPHGMNARREDRGTPDRALGHIEPRRNRAVTRGHLLGRIGVPWMELHPGDVTEPALDVRGADDQRQPPRISGAPDDSGENNREEQQEQRAASESHREGIIGP